MKNIYVITLLLSCQCLHAQSEILDANKVTANVNANGCLFTSITNSSAGYGILDANGLGAKVIYNSAFWIGAKDQNDSVRVCANMFIADNKDFKTGPVASTYSNQSFIDKYDHVYSITSGQIQTHQQNWNNPNYTMPADILNWPGNGNASNGEAAILAAFVDYNGNSLYEPSLGDYPVIRGDEAQYFILNDNDGNHPHSGGMNLDMEYHFMVYQFVQSGFLDSTTFINLKVINRSQNTYNQLIVGNYIDFDMGGVLDDYTGCSSAKNMVFGYDSENGNTAGSLFGGNPPACGVQLLNHNMAVSGTFKSVGDVQGDPFVDSTIWRALNAQWKNGLPYTYGGTGIGGTIPTTYLFDGNPNDTSLWTDQDAGDRRAFLASEPIDSFMPNDYICYDFAVLYSQNGGNNLLNVNGLFDVADSAQAFYDAQSFFYCEPLLLGVEGFVTETDDVLIYPNPAQKDFRISTDGTFDVAVYDITGKIINEFSGVKQFQSISAPINSGIYLVEITQNGRSSTKKLVVE